MHAIMSAVSGVERQKGDNHLNVAVLKGGYYETSDALKDAKTHRVYVLDENVFNEHGIDQAFDTSPVGNPIDLIVGEFHHNISVDFQRYRPVNMRNQIKAMVERGLVAEKCTVVFDITMDLEQSDEARDFFSDPVIQQLIADGKLNVVLTRSAQKYDMLGMDNYNGGIAITVNKDAAFSEFNRRMAIPEDQLHGLSYQGLTHLQKCVGPLRDEYRRAIMANTQYVYRTLPKACIFAEGSRNPMQISQIEDPTLVFLDIKFPEIKEDHSANASPISEAVQGKLREVISLAGLPITDRPSFGFATTNLTFIGEKKMRLTIGLESKRTLDLYVHFFSKIQSAIEKGMHMPGKQNQNIVDAIAAISPHFMEEEIAREGSQLVVEQP